jgi:hypothetical protein
MTTSPSCSVATSPEPLLDLVAELALRVAALALLLGLADAEDDLEPRGQRGRDLLGQRLVGLAEQLAPLGVPEDDAVDVELDEHARGDLPRVGALLGPVHVLRVDLDAGAARGVDHRRERRVGHAERDVHAVGGAHPGQQPLDERLGLVDRLVHLPVAGDERRAGHDRTSTPGRACPR